MNVFDAEGWSDGSTWAALVALQASHEVSWSAESEGFVVLGHAAAREVLTDSRRFSSARGTGARDVQLDGGQSLNLADPPASTALRHEVLAVLNEARIEALEPFITSRAAELVQALASRGGGDFLHEVAEVLALETFGQLFELDEDVLHQLGTTTRLLARAEHIAPHDAAAVWASANAQLIAVLERAVALRKGPLWSLGEGRIAPRDVVFLLRLLAQTGHESTAHALTSALVTLATEPLPHANLELAADELLRLASPLLRFARVTTRATTVSGVDIEQGRRVVVIFPLVNRDPRIFDDANQFIATRAPNPHLAFGAGPHACAGASLARLQVIALLKALQRTRVPRSVVPVPLRSSVTRGFSACGVSW